MTDEISNNQSNNEVSIKRFGILLKENGFSVEPLKDSSDNVEVILIKENELLQVCNLLKTNSESCFDLLISVSGVDKIKDNIIESVYHLYSTKYNHKLVLKAQLKREKPTVTSVTSVWKTADWHERETYDLMGIVYTGHPNLKRLLLPSDWIGHPLRKDYVLADERLKWNER